MKKLTLFYLLLLTSCGMAPPQMPKYVYIDKPIRCHFSTLNQIPMLISTNPKVDAGTLFAEMKGTLLNDQALITSLQKDIKVCENVK